MCEPVLSAKNLTLLLLASTALLPSGRAVAQQQPPTSDQRTSTLQEVVVTAERRPESIQKVPINVTAFSAQQLVKAGVEDTADLVKLTPGLEMGGEGRSVTLRGVGRNAFTAGSDSAVAFYVDDVYHGSAIGLPTDLDSVQDIEVLKGPQGTLFGRNATGGLISLKTRTPQAAPELDMKVGYESYNTTDDSLYATGGLTNNLRASLSANVHYQGDGYGRNLATGLRVDATRYYQFRGKLLWEPTTADRITFEGEYFRDTSDDQVTTIAPGTVGSTGAIYPGSIYNIEWPITPHFGTETYGGNINWEHDFNAALTFKSVTAYGNVFYNLDNYNEISGPTPIETANVDEKEWTFQQELLLQGKTSRLNYTFGAFYYTDGTKENLDIYFPDQDAAHLTIHIPAITGLNSYSAFGQVDYKITDRDTLTLGGRFTDDRISIKGGETINAPPAFAGAAASNYQVFTWRGAFKHEFSDTLMAYVSANKGYNSPTYNAAAPVSGLPPPASPISPPVRPEYLYAYEGGMKGTFLDGHLRVDGSGYYYNYSDLQVQVYRDGATLLLNAAKARIYGADLEVDANIPVALGDLEVRGSASLLHSEYNSFPVCTIFTPNPAGGGIQNQNGVCTGNHLVDAAPFQLTINPYYTVPLDRIGGRGGEIEFGVTYYHSDGYFYDIGNVERQRPYDLVDAEVSFLFSDRRARLQFYVQNLTDARVPTSLLGQASEFHIGARLAPRLFGVRLNYKWK